MCGYHGKGGDERQSWGASKAGLGAPPYFEEKIRANLDASGVPGLREPQCTL